MKKFFFLVASIALFISWAPKPTRVSEEWLPETFNPSAGALLIMAHPLGEKQNTRMEKYLQENYPYAFEIVEVSGNDFSLPAKYNDLKKYPFLIVWDFNMTRNALTKTNGADLYGHFIDRNTKEMFPSMKKLFGYGQIGYRPYITNVVRKFK